MNERRFERAIDLLLELEGGYVDHPDDPGRETKFGISARAYPGLDIENLTRDDAEAIYRLDYWEKAGCHRLPAPFDVLVFDMAVHSGVKTAVTMLQRLVGAEPDGKIGPRTLAAVDRAGAQGPARYLAKRLEFLQSLPSWRTFGRGWAYRLFRVALGAA